MRQRKFIHAKISHIIKPVISLALQTNCIFKHSKTKQHFCPWRYYNFQIGRKELVSLLVGSLFDFHLEANG